MNYHFYLYYINWYSFIRNTIAMKLHFFNPQSKIYYDYLRSFCNGKIYLVLKETFTKLILNVNKHKLIRVFLRTT